MAITAIKNQEGKTFFGGKKGELGPAKVYWDTGAKKNLTGTIDIDTLGNVTGVGTLFTTELKVGDYILAANALYQIKSITSNTAADVVKPPTVAVPTLTTFKKHTTLYLGLTQSIELVDNQKFSPISFIQTGDNPVNHIETGYEATIKVNMGEASVSNLDYLFEHIKASRDATSGAVEGYFRTISVGSAHSDYWARLAVVKMKAGTDSLDPLESVTFLRCAPIGNIQATYDATSQRVVEVTFQVYASAYFYNGKNIMWYSGDTSADAAGITDENGSPIVLDTVFDVDYQ